MEVGPRPSRRPDRARNPSGRRLLHHVGSKEALLVSLLHSPRPAGCDALGEWRLRAHTVSEEKFRDLFGRKQVFQSRRCLGVFIVGFVSSVVLLAACDVPDRDVKITGWAAAGSP